MTSMKTSNSQALYNIIPHTIYTNGPIFPCRSALVGNLSCIPQIPTHCPQQPLGHAPLLQPRAHDLLLPRRSRSSWTREQPPVTTKRLPGSSLEQEAPLWLDGADLFSDQLRSLPAREALLMSHDSAGLVWRKEGGRKRAAGRTDGRTSSCG